MKAKLIGAASTLMMALGMATAAAEDIPEKLFVDASVPFQGQQIDGSSWYNAFPTIQEAIDYAVTNVGYEDAHILVAEGTYYPTTRGFDDNNDGILQDEEKSIVLLGAVRLHGGYIGWNNGSPGSTDPFSPDGAYQKTVLSGDIGAARVLADNTYHVLFAQEDSNLSDSVIDGVTGAILIDGFRVEAGNADALQGTASEGGGLYVDGLPIVGSDPLPITIENCIFRRNYAAELGGAICARTQSALLKIRFCTFVENNARVGGALFLNQGFAENEDVKIGNTTFRDNGNPTWAPAFGTTTERGGAIFIAFEGEVDGSNLVFVDNEADQGAAVFWEPPAQTASGEYEQTWWHCTFAFNHASTVSNAAYQVQGASPGSGARLVSEFYNTIFWDDGVTSPDYPDILVGSRTIAILDWTYYDLITTGGGVYNIGPQTIWSLAPFNGDPFLDSPNRDLRLSPSSACINAGNPFGGMMLLTGTGPDIIDVDLDGDTAEALPLDFALVNRVINGAPDMGAYEKP